MKQRVLAIHLPHLLAQRALREARVPEGVPVVIHDPGGRVLCMDSAAESRGILPGMSLGSVRTLLPSLGVLPVEEQDMTIVFELARSLDDLSPIIRLLPPKDIFLELHEVLHLHGGKEEALLGEVLSRVRTWGYEHRIASADTYCAAAMAARRNLTGGPRVLNLGEEAAFMADLTFEEIGLPSDSIKYLRLLGLRRLGQVMDLDRAALQRRIPQGGWLWDLARRDDAPYRGLERLRFLHQESEEIIFDPPVYDSGPLLFLSRTRLEKLCRGLASKGEHLCTLELAVYGAQGEILWEDRIRPARPSSDPVLLLGLLRLKLEALFLREAAASMVLSPSHTCPESPRVDDLFWRHLRNEEQWQQLFERVQTSAGATIERFSVPGRDPIPERAVHTEPAPSPHSGKGVGAAPAAVDWLQQSDLGLPGFLPEDSGALCTCLPPLLLPQALPVDVKSEGYIIWRGRRHRIRGVRPLGRIQSDWWKEDKTDRTYSRLSLDQGPGLLVFKDELRGDWWLQGVFD